VAPGHGQEVEPSEVVLSLETQRLDAMVKADSVFLDRVFADDLTYAHSNGVMHSKAELMGLLSAGRMDYVSIHPDNLTVRVYQSAAVVMGMADIAVSTGEDVVAIAIRFTSVYVMEGDSWRLVAYQSTRFEEASGK
jgi:hypothetical protein